MPYHVSPFSLDAVQLQTDSKVKFELGEEYCFECSPYKIRHDMHLGRLQADQFSDVRNFGFKKWWIVTGGEEDIVVDIVKPLEGSQTCNIFLECATETASFTGTQDLETGSVAQAMQDV